MKKSRIYLLALWGIGLTGLLFTAGCIEDERRDFAAEEKAERDQFLANNNITIDPTATGLYFILEDSGSGPNAELGDSVSIFYAGYYLNGLIIATNIESVAIAHNVTQYFYDYDPLAFVLGEEGYVLQGIEEGLTYMNEGCNAHMVIPSELAVPGTYRTLFYYIELVTLVKASP